MGLQPAAPGAAGLLPQPASAARQPAESAAVADAGLWPAAAAAVAAAAVAAAVAAAGRSSVSAAVGSFLGTPQGTGQLLVAGLLGVLPETEQEKVARNEEVNREACLRMIL